MIKLEGDKLSLYQWDLNQRVILSNIDAGIEVHFSDIYNTQDDCPVVKAYEENGFVYANIPNILLQKSGIIVAYLYVNQGDKAWTEHRAEILVLARSKPADYVYTETEVFSYKKLEDRMSLIEKSTIYVESAKVGQIVKITKVDEKGVPIEWEAMDVPTYSAEDVGAVGKEELPEAINTALSQAKESGEFNGPQGERGPVGPQGPQGPQGIQGIQGERGETGATGPTGPQGPTGESGKDGAIGPQGPKGDKGDKGDTGETGPQGPVGETGPQGEQGPAGPQGEKGEKGDTGSVGPQGPQGEVGPQGPAGKDGEKGADGAQGPKGDKGDKGDAGSQGPAGKDGKDYVLTSADKTEIAEMAAEMVDVPGGGGSGESVVHADFAQNDPTKSSYVKNRPFYAENEGEITEIVPETTFTIDNEGMWYSEKFAIPIEAGNTYICKYNGVEYICTAFGYTQDGTEGIILGNMGKAGADFEDTGEPFVIVTIPVDNMTMVILHDGTVSTNITFSITMNNEVIHKLPNKYLDLDWKPTKEYKLTDVFQINNVTFTGKQITIIDSQVFYLHVGEEYTVNWNGTEYVCEAKRIDADTFSIFYIGNTELASLTDKEDTGEPFIYIYFATRANTNVFYARLIKSNSTEETITCSVKGYTDVYNKIPTNFLPDSYVIPTDIDAGLVINELRLADKAFQEGRRVYARKGGVFGQVIYLNFDSVDGIFNQMWFVSDSKMFYIWSYEYGSTNGVAKTNYIVVGLVPDISGTRGYSVPVPSEMKAGQMVRLKSIDESKASGYNMAWEAVDPWVIESSTAGSTKKFKLTVDDSGTISTTEVTE